MPTAQSLHLLVAEDHELDRALMAAYISSLRWTAVYVPDGQAAVELAQTEPFDALVLDYNMPNLTGLEAIHKIRTAVGPNALAPAMIWTNADPYEIAAMTISSADLAIRRKPVVRDLLADWLIEATRSDRRSTG